ncbi:hypothetical protein BZG36_00576 [Bifiguratus adelaidae]|uniref:BTB domain-containing protein n=1 Tax=Bifiguratus adelaidae TaxID=1938954 RepID=A0A261Y753_9FUNG|nr:hypothetical protein BZG36_00576 [Bifiguratus adelaidae]
MAAKGVPPSKRHGHTANLWNNYIVIFGGCNEYQEYCNDVHIFDIEKQTWTRPDVRGSHNVAARYLHTATVYDDKLFVYGGFAKKPEYTYVLEELSILDLKTFTWIQHHPVPPRYNHSATLINSKLYIYAGKDEHGTTVSDLFCIELSTENYVPHQILGAHYGHYGARGQLVLLKSQHFCEAVCGKLLVFGKYIVNDGPNHSGNLTMGGSNGTLSSSNRTSNTSPQVLTTGTPVYGLWMLDLDTLEWKRMDCSSNFDVGGWNCFTVVNDLDSPVQARQNSASRRWQNQPSGHPSSSAMIIDSDLQKALPSNSNLLFLGNTDPVRPQGYDHFREALYIPTESLGLYDIPTSQISNEFSHLLGTVDLSDFVIATSDGHEIPVHKVILMTRWSHFQNIFRSGMIEATQNRMEVPEPYPVVYVFLKYIYTDHVSEHESTDVLCDLLVMANMYLIPRLAKMCCEILYRHHLSIESCGMIFEKAIMSAEIGLKMLTVEFMFRHLGALLRSGAIMEMGPEIRDEFLESVPEEAVLEVSGRRGSWASVGSGQGSTKGSPGAVVGPGFVDVMDSRGNVDETSDLPRTILRALSKTPGKKSIPTMVLYDGKGLQLFDQITYLDEYYLTNAEIDIMRRRVTEIVSYINDGSVVVELGAGSLRKTSLILEELNRSKRDISYFALDLDKDELLKSLKSIGDNYQNVSVTGLWGEYMEGMRWISEHVPSNVSKTLMWLGSSIGNMSRADAGAFIQSFREQAMDVGDLFLIGIDRRNDSDKIMRAYNDSNGVTEEFIMNGLDHVNSIFGGDFIDRRKFAYEAGYNEEEGRHQAFYRSLEDQVLQVPSSYSDVDPIRVQKGELIHIEFSYKYSPEESLQLFDNARLRLVEAWADSHQQYDLHLLQKAPFHFSRQNSDFSKIPTLQEFQELWAAWDTVVETMIPRDKLFERPISLRHPLLFYTGHIPSFLDIQVSKALSEPTTEPRHFAEIFERGIDPDMEDPTKCHDHSEVPEEEDLWPTIDEINAFKGRVRQRVRNFYATFDSMDTITRKRLHFALWMGFEHEIMHLETILYMLLQSPNVLPPAGFAYPRGLGDITNLSEPVSSRDLEDRLYESTLIEVPAGPVTLGQDQRSDHDFGKDEEIHAAYGWDNESPKRQEHVDGFKMLNRPVTVGEYLQFLTATGALEDDNLFPLSWIRPFSDKPDLIALKTVYGPTSLNIACNWPVCVSYDQAAAYASWKDARVPTENEWVRFRDTQDSSIISRNLSLNHWHPLPVARPTKAQVGSSVWEWTSSVWEAYPGFVASVSYPGYSADFFDEKHNTILGASWATHPRIGQRPSFRNWYQRGYPYVVAGFRICF